MMEAVLCLPTNVMETIIVLMAQMKTIVFQVCIQQLTASGEDIRGLYSIGHISSPLLSGSYLTYCMLSRGYLTYCLLSRGYTYCVGYLTYRWLIKSTFNKTHY